MRHNDTQRFCDAIQGIVGVYDADSTAFESLTRAVRQMRGKACALCDITHGLLREKRDWAQCQRELAVPVSVVYRDELDEAMAAAAAGRFPAVLAKTPDGAALLLGPEDLRACGGDAGALQQRLQAVLGLGGTAMSAWA